MKETDSWQSIVDSLFDIKTEIRDDGIGRYEFWGSPGYDSQPVEVISDIIPPAEQLFPTDLNGRLDVEFWWRDIKYIMVIDIVNGVVTEVEDWFPA